MALLASVDLFGKIPTKKNAYVPKKTGGMFKPKKVTDPINNIAEQLYTGYPQLRGANMEHPDILVQFRLPRERMKQYDPWESDQDGKWTTLLDILVNQQILLDDSFLFCNGSKLLLPAQGIDSIDEVTVLFFERHTMLPELFDSNRREDLARIYRLCLLPGYVGVVPAA